MKGLHLFGACAFLLACVPASADESSGTINYGIGFENGGSETVGPYKALGYMLLTNQLGWNEKLKLDVVSATSTLEELDGYAATLEQPFGGGWKLTVYGGYNIIRPGDPIARFFDQDTAYYATQAIVSRTFQLSDRTVAQISGGIATSDIETERISKIQGLDDANFEQRTRDIQVGFAARHDFSKDTGLFGSIWLQQGVDWLDPISNRVAVDNTPTVVIADTTFTHNLPMSWQFSAKGTLQWTDDRVTPVKQFTLGGWQYATGYEPGEASGDIGGGFRLELSHLSVSTFPNGSDKIYFKPFVFIDGGFVRLNDPIAVEGEQSGVREETSAGFGLSVQSASGVHGAIQVSYPLSGRPITEPDQDSDARILFSIGIKR